MHSLLDDYVSFIEKWRRLLFINDRLEAVITNINKIGRLLECLKLFVLELTILDFLFTVDSDS